MRTRHTAAVILLGTSIFAAPKPPGSTACRIIPAVALEAHFGMKLKSVHGADANGLSMCSVDVPDRRHGADLSVQPKGSGSMTVDQRLAKMKPQLDREGSQVKNYGTVGCYTGKLELGAAKLPTVTCFLENNGYVSLSLRSDNQKHLSFDATKALLEKAAALRR